MYGQEPHIKTYFICDWPCRNRLCRTNVHRNGLSQKQEIFEIKKGLKIQIGSLSRDFTTTRTVAKNRLSSCTIYSLINRWTLQPLSGLVETAISSCVDFTIHRRSDQIWRLTFVKSDLNSADCRHFQTSTKATNAAPFAMIMHNNPAILSLL